LKPEPGESQPTRPKQFQPPHHGPPWGKWIPIRTRPAQQAGPSPGIAVYPQSPHARFRRQSAREKRTTDRLIAQGGKPHGPKRESPNGRQPDNGWKAVPQAPFPGVGSTTQRVLAKNLGDGLCKGPGGISPKVWQNVDGHPARPGGIPGSPETGNGSQGTWPRGPRDGPAPKRRKRRASTWQFGGSPFAEGFSSPPAPRGGAGALESFRRRGDPEPPGEWGPLSA